MKRNRQIGSTLDDFLKQEGIYEDATTYAVKEVLAWQVGKAMEDLGISKAEMARRMGTSRAHLDRLLDPRNDKVQLDTMQRAAAVLGRRLLVQLS
jgi:transcriptional regulator with XRE-family HTH domain